MKASIIIAVYKDTQALDIILKQLKKQDYDNFEVIIAEDDKNQDICKLIANYSELNIIHCSQDDLGIRKMRSQNNAISASTGDYLIFIDGDCIPYDTFISSHISCSKKGYVLSGRRVNLGPMFSRWIRDGKLAPDTISSLFMLFFIPLLIDGKEGHIESGFCFKANGVIHKLFLSKFKRTASILGCNFSCYKSDLLKINGFDESYGETAIGDDTDIEWRLQTIGLKLRSVKNIANVFHLYHPKRNRTIPNHDELLKLMHQRKKNGDYFASVGLDSHKDS